MAHEIVQAHDRRDLPEELQHASQELAKADLNRKPLIAVAICHRLVGLDSHAKELRRLLNESTLVEQLTEALGAHKPKLLSESLLDCEVALFLAALQRRKLVFASDVTDTIATISADEKSPYKMVPTGIRDMLRSGTPVILISGDTIKNIVDAFLIPAHLVSIDQDNRIQSKIDLSKLRVIGDSGASELAFSNGVAHQQGFIPGIPPRYIERIKTFLDALTLNYDLVDRFRPIYAATMPPGYIDPVGDVESDNLALKYFPFGDGITSNLRNLLADNVEHQALRSQLVLELNELLKRNDMRPVFALAAGKTTIDIGTATKAMAIEKLRQEPQYSSTFFFYLGDAISNGGNDLPAAKKSDLALQVGKPVNENVELLTALEISVLRNAYPAKEGGLEPYLAIFKSAVRLSACVTSNY